MLVLLGFLCSTALEGIQANREFAPMGGRSSALRSVDWFGASGPMDPCEVPAGIQRLNDDPMSGESDKTGGLMPISVCKGVSYSYDILHS